MTDLTLSQTDHGLSDSVSTIPFRWGYLFFATLLLSVGFGAFLSQQRVTDPFLYFDTAFVAKTQHLGELRFPDSTHYASLKLVPGRQILMLEFANLMGISAQALQFLPIGTLLIAALWFLLALFLLNSPSLACAVSLYMTLNLSYATNLYSVFAYAFALPMFMACVILQFYFFQKKDMRAIILLMILFISLNSIHYTMTGWLIVFLLVANTLIWWQQRMGKREATRLNPLYYILPVYFVIFFYFNNTVYNSFLPLLGYEANSGGLDRFLGYLSVTNSPYTFIQPRLLSMLSIAPLLLVIFPVMIGGLYDIGHFLRRPRQQAWSSVFIIVIALVGVAAIDTLAYSIRGGISTKALAILLPFIALYYLQRWRSQVLPYMLALLLVITSLAKLVSFYSYDFVVGHENRSSDASHIESSTDWLLSYVGTQDYNKVLLSDLLTYGKIQVSMAEENKLDPFAFRGYTTYELKALTGALEESIEWPDVIVVDKVSKEPAASFFWSRFRPIKEFWQPMTLNPHLGQVYDNGMMGILLPIHP